MNLTRVFERIGLLEQEERDDSKNRGSYGEQRLEKTSEPDDSKSTINSKNRLANDKPVESDLAYSDDIDESRTITDVYAEANIPESPFPADKLLKLLEGLNSLPEEVRKQAISAMDAAEDSWTIEDPILDAQRRIQALEAEQMALEQRAKSAESQAESDLAAQSRYQEQASAQIHQQIRELEELLAAELKTVAEAREKIKAQAIAARKTCRSQQSNLESEIKRLRLISELFDPSNDESTTRNNHPSGSKNG